MTAPNEQQNHTLPFAVVTGLFFMWGFTTCMNDILIPYLKGVFDLSHTEAMFVQFAFFGAYFVGSLVYFLVSARSGDPIGRMGYRNGIVLGLLLSALGTALFYPAAEMVSYGFFLSALFVLGLGFTLLQIAANPYVAILGSPRTASSRLNLAQGFNSFGTTIAPVIGGYFIFRYFAGPDHAGADSVKVPYLILTGMFVLMAVVMRVVRLPEFSSGHSVERGAGALRHRHTLFGMLAIFMYVGAEVSIGSIMISFLGLKEIAGLAPADASTYVSFYWGGLMIGRFLGAVSLSGVRNSRKYVLMAAIPVAAFVAIIFLQDWQIAQNYGIFLVLSFGGFPRRAFDARAHADGLRIVLRRAARRGLDDQRHRCDVDGNRHRAVQFHHVVEHLHAVHRRTGQGHQPGVLPACHGHRGRSDPSRAAGRGG
jgi:MFS transporter, FHS family, L-fucose permease